MERLSARIMRKGGWWVKTYFEAHQQSCIQQQRGIIAQMSGKRPREVLGSDDPCALPVDYFSCGGTMKIQRLSVFKVASDLGIPILKCLEEVSFARCRCSAYFRNPVCSQCLKLDMDITETDWWFFKKLSMLRLHQV